MSAPPPILMLPVRLETRFIPSGTNVQMMVRFYPDDVHIDTHERDLTQAESGWGDAFWSQFNAGTAQLGAWNRLAHRFGPRRAAWIARVRKPDPPPLGPPVTVGSRAESWTRAPHTNVLPDHWTVVGYSAAGARLFSADGAAITGYPHPTDPVPTGPSPNGTVSNNRTPPVDDGMLWMTDYPTAVARGMAVTVTLSADQRKQLDRVVAFGWKAADATAAVGDLFQAHQYTRGLSFLPAGSSTSNADVASAFDSKAGFDAATLDLETTAPRPLTADSDGHATAVALALDDAIFARVGAADMTQSADAMAMNAALWAATGRYFLEQMMAGGFTYSQTTVDAVRRHFLDSVRGLGPLPAVRIGVQPYALLPVMSLAKWTSTDPVLAAMARFARALQPTWAASEAAVATDPQQQLLDVLSQEGISVAYSVRALVGPGYADYLWQFLGHGEINTAWWNAQKQTVAPQLKLLGFTTDPLLSRAVFADQQTTFDAPLVGDNPDSYLTWLRTVASGYLEIRDETSSPAPNPKPLLYRLSRHSTLREYAAATYAFPAPGSPGPHLDRELVRVRPGVETTVWDDIQTNATELDGIRSGNAPPAELAGFKEFLDSLQHLAALPASTLELLFASTLDLFTNRLDAWITSFATRRLTDLRKAQPTGVLVGGYGWVEGLGRQLAPGDQAGFIHAPSLTQAVTAGVMRSAHLSHVGSAGAAADVLSANLSSESVRLAMTILSAVRDGQPLGAVLGYLFERWLHEATGLDQYVDPFRAIAASGELGRLGDALASATAAADAADKALRDSQAAAGAADVNAAASATALATAKANLAAAQQQVGIDQIFFDSLTPVIKVFTDLINAEKRNGQTPTAAETKGLNDLTTLQGNLGTTIGALNGQINSVLPAAVTTAQQANDDAVNAVSTAAGDVAAKTRALNAAAALAAVAQADFDRVRVSLIDTYQLTEGATADPVSAAVESLAAPAVVDGVALDRLNTAGGMPWGKNRPTGLSLPPPDTTVNSDYNRLVAQLLRLHEAVRSISDLLAAEGVFQAVRGNPHRAAATLDAIGKGLAMPPELEVVRTPRTGATLTERLLVLFAGAPPAPGGWSSGSPRAAAEPWLNYWAGTLIGDPSAVVCRANYLDATGKVVTPTAVSLHDLGLSPLDVVQLSDSQLGDPASEMRQRLAFFLAPPTAPAVSIQLVFDRPPPSPGQSPGQLGFAETLEVARVFRDLTHSRAATAIDLVPPGQAGADGVDAAEIKARAIAAKAALKVVLGNLNAGPGANAALMAAASFGVAGAIPPPPPAAAAAAQLTQVAAEVQRRLDSAGPADPTGVDDSVRQLQAVFGGDFAVLPRFTPANAPEITTALTVSDATQGGDPLQADTWVEQMSWVRDGPRRLQRLLAYADALGNLATGYQVVQLPYVAKAQWGALPGATAPGGAVGLVLHSPAGTNLSGEAAGLVIDDLVEVIPNAQETTGVAFQFEHPAARAPQALLLAVPPDDQPWSAATLEATLLETIALVEQVRPVDPDSLKGLGQFLPALYFAFNEGPDTVSTELLKVGS